MADIRSFKGYIDKKYNNEIWDALFEFAAESPNKLELSSYRVSRPDEAELADMNIRRVDLYDSANGEICFDVIVETEITISETVRRNRESDDKEQWFRLSCSATINDEGIHDFYIKQIEVYDRRAENKTAILSDGFVPIIAKENFDAVAEAFLTEYYPEALAKPMAVDINEVARRMGLEIKEKRLSRYFTLFGEMVFRDGEIDIFSVTERRYVPTAVKRGTILVDPKVYFMRNIGSYNNTVIHECIHWYKHRKYHWLAGLYRSDANRIECKVDEKYDYRNRKKWTDWDWMEWQANGIAPRVLMPRKQARIKIDELIEKNSKLYDDRLYVLECVIFELSDFFGVSRTAAKIRMLDLGYKEVEGVLTYVDDRYIKNYAFNADSKERNQSYSIGLVDSFYEYYANPAFRKIIDSGNFAYIDSHVVINDSKYVKETIGGGLDLTDYAKQNVHECCLIFDLKLTKIDTANIGEYLANVMFRSAESFSCNPIFNENAHNMEIFNRSEELMKFRESLLADAEFAREHSNNFSVLAWAHIQRCNCHYKETFRERTLLSDKMFDRIKKGEVLNPEIETVMAICMGLNLGAAHGIPLLRSAGYDLTDTQSPILISYMKLLASPEVKDIFQCNEILEALNLKPLCEKEYRAVLANRQQIKF